MLSYKFIAIIVVQIKTFKDNNTQSEYSIITEKTKTYVLEKESIQKHYTKKPLEAQGHKSPHVSEN